MIVNDASSKIDLCIKELMLIKEILNSKVSDDFCSRILSTYAMVRVDDITKLWGHTIPKSDDSRKEYNMILKSYNEGLRVVRDKLGAHYQSPSKDVDLFASMQVFRSIDYANTLCLIEQIFVFHENNDGSSLMHAGFCSGTDLNEVKQTLYRLYSDDQASITNGALDLFGVNKGGLISCTPAQKKAQQIRSIEMMVDVSYALANHLYEEKAVQNMFKRLFVCMVYNYFDNLITRSDINEKSVQYEEGFDKLFISLISPKDNRQELEQAFIRFEAMYHVETYMKRNRRIRDQSCAHIDEHSRFSTIQNELDTLEIEALHNVFIQMLDMSNYICNNVCTLKFLALPPRTIMYDAQMETIPEIETFYGESPVSTPLQELSITDILRSIRKQDNRYDEASYKLRSILMSNNESAYHKMIDAISGRLREPNVSDIELSAIITALCNAKNGYPKRLQESVILMLKDEKIFSNHIIHLLCVLSKVCIDDERIDIAKYLDSIIIQKHLIPTVFATLAYLHMTVERTKSCIVGNNKAHQVDQAFLGYCNSLSSPMEQCALLLTLSQRWFCDPDYSFYRSYESNYSLFYETEVENALNRYFTHIKLTDKNQMDLCKHYLQTKHYLLLFYRLSVLEKERKQQKNVFLDLWKYNCLYRTKYDIYEAFGVGLLTELSGKIDAARAIFESLVKENPINESAIHMLQEFNRRHSKL